MEYRSFTARRKIPPLNRSYFSDGRIDVFFC